MAVMNFLANSLPRLESLRQGPFDT